MRRTESKRNSLDPLLCVFNPGFTVELLWGALKNTNAYPWDSDLFQRGSELASL